MSVHPAGAPSGKLFSLNADVWTEPYWAAARALRLVCQRCAACGRFRMPPAPFCSACRSQSTEWVELPGTGSVYSFTVVRHTPIPEMRSSLPYVIAVVALDGAPHARLVTNIVECDPSAVAVDQRVRVVWDKLGNDVVVARFTPVAAVGTFEGDARA
jgi:uncharacterized OB-fold protein